jgi:hypothetical protein
VSEPDRGLRGLSEPRGSTHFQGDGLGHLVHLGAVNLDYFSEECQALRHRCFGEGRKGLGGGGDGIVDIVRGAEGDGGDLLFSGRVNDRKVVRLCWIDPLPIDEELATVFH